MFKIDFKKEYEINKMNFVYSRTKKRKILFAHKKNVTKEG